MAIKTTGASIITSKSAISSGLVIVNRPEGYVITGPRVEAGTTFKKLVVTPGSPDNVEDITGGGGGTAPTITSIVVTDASWVPTGLNVIDSDLGGFIEINGTNFDSGAIVYLNGEALTTTFVDSTKLRVVVPPTTAGVYAIMLFNSDDVGTIFTNLTLSIAPTFITPAGSLGSFYETLPVVANVSANADSNVTYAVFSGSFPAGLTLVSGNGNITGNAPPVSSETNYPFVVSATDEEFQASTRSFSMTILPDLVTWIVPSDLDDFILVNNEPIASITLNASAISGQSVSYTANILPEGLTIVGSAVTGTPLAEGNTNTRLTATSASTNKTGNVDVLFKIRDRWKVDNYGLINSSNCIFSLSSDIFIDSSGRHFFTINSTDDRINQFFLTKPWSIRTATFVTYISVASFDPSPLGIDFKPDGTKMFISGSASDRIYEFALPTAWDITSATNIGNVLLTSLSAFTNGPYQLRFHSDGTKFYVNDGGASLTRIYQFNLSVPWQANTASNVKLGTSTDYYTIPATGADGRLRGMDFSSDFSKFYGSFGTQTNIIAEFDLQTPGQANNMSLVTVYNHSLYPKYYSVASSKFETWYNIDGPIRLKPDGTKMYKGIRGSSDIFIDSSGRHFFTINPSNDRIYQFFLTKPWSIRTATFVTYISVASFDPSPLGIDFKPDGTKMFISGSASDRIYEFALPTAWDITSATNIGNVLLTSLSAFSIGPRQLRFHSDGAKFYVGDVATTRIYQFNLSVPWQANTASNVKLGTSTDYYTIPATGADGRLRGMDFSSDFSKFYGSFGTQTNIIAEFDLQTPGQANNMSLVTVYNHSLYPKYYSVASSKFETWYNIDGPIRLKPDGTKMYTGIRGFNFVTELSLPTPYSVATLSIDRDVKGFLYIAGLEIEPTGMYITPDGTKLFFIGSTSGSIQKDVFEISLSVPYDIASGIAISNTLGSYQPEISTDITGIEFKPDGTKMFLCETSTDKVFEFKLNTAWASNSAVRIGSITVSDNPEGVIFKPDGTKMFVCNNAADRLTEWALSTPWQVNTAVQIGLLSISAIESSPVEFAFKPDGNVFYVIGSGGDRIYQFNLSTPWQVNTAVYVSSILIGNFESVPESIRISNDGNYIYFLGQNKDYIWQFGLN